MVTILPIEGVPAELSERGFIIFSSPRESDDDTFNNTLIVLGSLENNNTEIDCQPKLGQSEVDLPPATLTVIGTYMNITEINVECRHCHIGPPEAPVAVNGSVLQFSPVVIVRLEWQAPFSHTGHHILYYTVYTAQSTETNVPDVSHDLHIINGEFSCKAYIAVSATNDIGESKLSVVTSILKGSYSVYFVNATF